MTSWERERADQRVVRRACGNCDALGERERRESSLYRIRTGGTSERHDKHVQSTISTVRTTSKMNITFVPMWSWRTPRYQMPWPCYIWNNTTTKYFGGLTLLKQILCKQGKQKRKDWHHRCFINECYGIVPFLQLRTPYLWCQTPSPMAVKSFLIHARHDHQISNRL
jgi:hypothetical protein